MENLHPQLLFFLSWLSKCTIAIISLAFISHGRLVQEDYSTHMCLVITFSIILLVNSLGLPETIHFLRTKRSLYIETLAETIPFLKREFLNIRLSLLMSELFHLAEHIFLVVAILLLWNTKDQQVARPIAICCLVFFMAYFIACWWAALQSYREPDYESEIDSNEGDTESEQARDAVA